MQMDDLDQSLAYSEAKESTSSVAVSDWFFGSRFVVRAQGKFSRGLDGRTGIVIGFAHTKNAIRVLLDGQKNPQTLHRRYLEPLVEVNLDGSPGVRSSNVRRG